MNPIYLTLIVLSVILVVFLISMGVLGLMKKRVQLYDKHLNSVVEFTGKDSTKYSLYYIFAGILWGIVTYLRIIE